MNSRQRIYLVSVLLGLLYLALQIIQAWFHAQSISSGIWTNHAYSAAFGMGTAVIISFLWKVLTKGSWLQVCFLMILLLSLRWIVFDISLNYFRGLPPGYIGLPDKGDALLDSMPALWHFLLKALFLILGFAGFLWSLRR